jgi:hypothetical protein
MGCWICHHTCIAASKALRVNASSGSHPGDDGQVSVERARFTEGRHMKASGAKFPSFPCTDESGLHSCVPPVEAWPPSWAPWISSDNARLGSGYPDCEASNQWQAATPVPMNVTPRGPRQVTIAFSGGQCCRPGRHASRMRKLDKGRWAASATKPQCPRLER